jgi:hypothetical protein
VAGGHVRRERSTPWGERRCGRNERRTIVRRSSHRAYSLLWISRQPPDDLWLPIVESIEIFTPTVLAAYPEVADPEP